MTRGIAIIQLPDQAIQLSVRRFTTYVKASFVAKPVTKPLEKHIIWFDSCEFVVLSQDRCCINKKCCRVNVCVSS